MNHRVMPNELMDGDEVLARPGFRGRMWVPDRSGTRRLTPLPIFPALPSSMASIPPVRLMILRLVGPYVHAARHNDFAPPSWVWFDTREVPLYEVPDEDAPE